MNVQELKSAVLRGHFDRAFVELYGENCNLEEVKNRYILCAEGFEQAYGSKNYGNLRMFSVAGRSEISGNHTDHNHGKVLAASISLDIISVAADNDTGVIGVKSQGFEEDYLTLENVDKVREREKYKSSAIIRGVCDGFKREGYNIGGFYAYTSSNVLKGSGLSSSAAFEDMIGNMLNHLYNKGRVDNVEIAKISQYAENTHFGKPCGLMDQIACAVGGFVTIDFENPNKPVVEKLPFELEKHGLSLCIVNTGGNHADLNEDYASVPFDMKRTAKFLGVEFLRQTTKEKLLENAAGIRKSLGDRCFMRALHFFNENDRVEMQKRALEKGDLYEFLKGVRRSGISSFTMLQNVYTAKNVDEQGLSVALALSSEVLENLENAAYRVHGGGFAGTIQSFVPNNVTEEYKNTLEKVFGKDSVYVLSVRKHGAVCLDELV